MTRITSFGRKRTYLEATSSSNLQDEPSSRPEDTASINIMPTSENDRDIAPPPRKKRKRTKPSMRDGNTGVKAAEAALEREKKKLEADARAQSGQLTKSAKKRMRESGKKLEERARKESSISASEWRRQKRINEKLQATVCYVCRNKGHAAKDCPDAEKLVSEEGQNTKVTGICYRCGSTKHTLARCKKPVDQSDPLPFASCFVCSGKGHLASSCPENKAKGVYPDGGCCKLCGETSHLAKDCGQRMKDVASNAVIDINIAAGADEDDFHSLKRQAFETEKRKGAESRARVDDSTSINVLKSSRVASIPAKKVVYF